VALKKGATLCRRARKFLGLRYVPGGHDLSKGVDSGGFVRSLYKEFGIELPQNPSDQVRVGMVVSAVDELWPGDRIYFTDMKREKIVSAAIYLGNNEYIQITRALGKVSIRRFNDKVLDTLVAGRRSF
jgi:cell wall-associated NlpC family hydrolase